MRFIVTEVIQSVYRLIKMSMGSMSTSMTLSAITIILIC